MVVEGSRQNLGSGLPLRKLISHAVSFEFSPSYSLGDDNRGRPYAFPKATISKERDMSRFISRSVIGRKALIVSSTS